MVWGISWWYEASKQVLLDNRISARFWGAAVLSYHYPHLFADRISVTFWAPSKSRRDGLVRLRTHSHSGVEVPVRLRIHRPVTEGYCVVATRGGEPPEVNCQSVTNASKAKAK